MALSAWIDSRRRPAEIQALSPDPSEASPDVSEKPTEADAPPSATWIPPGGAELTIAEQRIASGMIYVGAHLPPVAEPCDVEPALIDPRLPVEGGRAARLEETMTCWPAYRELSPQHRAEYLGWLARGRREPDIDIGYVFLFFYGLERRLLHDARHAPVGEVERAALEAEILALHECYARSASFRGYASGLLGAMWMGEETPVYARLPPPEEPRAGELPLLLRLGLGQLLRDGVPVPAAWALSWALGDPEGWPASLATVGRCPDALRERFHARYAETFGSGIVRRPEGRELIVHYRPASASFGGGLVLAAPGVPDVAPIREPVKRLRRLLERCMAELEPASLRPDLDR
ncbi:TerB N-terminal domain-containing protein [Chondromyces crocatus]|uniref:TerB N-terminal domain-containing protein n=1 Tax=Chondromyces crocatus TaxID=52 RepID=UPI00067D8225|nr:TerB N-terminal domain-containing protein [Chondromyces crocatus]